MDDLEHFQGKQSSVCTSEVDRDRKADVRVTLLGDFSIVVSGKSIPVCKSSKARMLLQLLILERGKPVSGEVLRDALWPNMDVSSSALRVAAHSLRKYLQKWVPSPSLRLLTCGAGGYQIDLTNTSVDCLEFERAVGIDTKCGDKKTSEDISRRRAIDLYRDDLLLGEEPLPWLDLRRYSFRSSYLAVLETEIGQATRLDESARIIQLATRILTFEPYNECAYRQLIEHHSKLGHRLLAQQWISICTQRLRDDLDTSPENETLRVFKRASSLEANRFDTFV